MVPIGPISKLFQNLEIGPHEPPPLKLTQSSLTVINFMFAHDSVLMESCFLGMPVKTKNLVIS